MIVSSSRVIALLLLCFIFWVMSPSVPVAPENLSPISHTLSLIYPTSPLTHISQQTSPALLRPHPLNWNLSHHHFLQVHTPVVRALHLHEVYANWVDKHEVTPEIVAGETRMEGTAEMLRGWAVNKDRELRER